LLNDNIDVARPGDEVEIVGIYTHKYDYGLNIKNGFPVFQTIIEANNISRLVDTEKMCDDEDVKRIKEFSRKSNIKEIIKNSIATSIHQHEDIKLGLALAMFSGVAKDI